SHARTSRARRERYVRRQGRDRPEIAHLNWNKRTTVLSTPKNKGVKTNAAVETAARLTSDRVKPLSAARRVRRRGRSCGSCSDVRLGPALRRCASLRRTATADRGRRGR